MCYEGATPISYECPPGGSSNFSVCVDSGVSCTEPTAYTCNAATKFLCGPREAGYSKFDCGSANGGFTCNGGELYDFHCNGDNSNDFNCLGNTFSCAANHQFLCVGYVDFTCKASTFICCAGGNHCNIGTSTGDYGFDEPGDFTCGGTPSAQNGSFSCDNTFYCRTADDFSCGGFDHKFTCSAPFGECAQTTGNFGCHPSYGFKCEQNEGNGFECPTGKYTVNIIDL
jgi:hypothetical protein